MHRLIVPDGTAVLIFSASVSGLIVSVSCLKKGFYGTVSRTYHPKLRAPAPRGTATQSRRGNSNDTGAGALCMEGPSLIRNYHKMGKRKGAYPASSEVAAAGDPNPTARLVLALLLLLVIIAIAFVVWRRARNRGPHCARHPKPRA